MSEYQYEDKKEYLIAKNEYWRIWNNGIIEQFYREKWIEQNSHHKWEQRLKFLKSWRKAEIGKNYEFSCVFNIVELHRGGVTFLGFREECPECKKSNLIWEEKIQLCKNCEYIHAFVIEDD